MPSRNNAATLSLRIHKFFFSSLGLYFRTLHQAFPTVNNNVIWMGLNDKATERTWIWVNGDRASIGDVTLWQPGQPASGGHDEDCGSLYFSKSALRLFDEPCNRDLNALCEKRVWCSACPEFHKLINEKGFIFSLWNVQSLSLKEISNCFCCDFIYLKWVHIFDKNFCFQVFQEILVILVLFVKLCRDEKVMPSFCPKASFLPYFQNSTVDLIQSALVKLFRSAAFLPNQQVIIIFSSSRMTSSLKKWYAVTKTKFVQHQINFHTLNWF